MNELKGATVKALALELYGYQMSDGTADAVSRLAGSIMAGARLFPTLNLAGLEPPFGYPTMVAEAARLRRR